MYTRRLETAAGLLARIIEDSGVPLSIYHQEKDAGTARERACYPRVLQSALRHLDRCYPQPVTRASAARHLGCNAAYLSTLFTRHLGRSFRQYLNQLRIGKAKRLLERTGETAGEIAFAVIQPSRGSCARLAPACLARRLATKLAIIRARVLEPTKRSRVWPFSCAPKAQNPIAQPNGLCSKKNLRPDFLCS